MAVGLIVVASMLVGPAATRVSASTAYSYTIWNGSPYIGNLAAPDSSAVELGVKFRADIAGSVTGVRFYKGPGNTGTHVGNLWTSTGALIASAIFAGESSSGWQQVSFGSAVPVNPGVTYIASYFAPNGHYSLTSGYQPGDFTSSVDNPPLHALANGLDGGNGVYSYSPSSTFPGVGAPNANNYWVDVVFSTTITTPPVANGFAPANASTGAALNTQVTAAFSEEVQPNTLSFKLVDSLGAAVPATVTWELHQADRTVTLDPVADLAPSTTYTAALSGGTDYAGNVMAPVSWSFTTTTTAQPSPSVIGQWQPVQNWPLVAVHSAVTYTGKFLGVDPQSPSTTSQLFDPTTGTFASASMGLDFFCAGETQMADGRIMFAGGDHGDNASVNATYGGAIKAVTAYDPATGVWTRLADMNLPRWYPALLRLSDGRILAVSGQPFEGAWQDTPEVYDPSSNTWTLLSGISTSDVHEDLYPNVYQLPDGRVLVIATSSGHTWILDLNAQTAVQGPSAPMFDASSVMYRPGKILLAGGSAAHYGTGVVATAATLDMTAPTPAWQTIPSLRYARGYAQLTNLPDGRVLVVGGSSSTFTTTSRSGALPAEIWNPTTNTWTVGHAMQDQRNNHSTGVLMPDATFLAAGGGHEMRTGAIDYFTAETYSPPYFYGSVRPTITTAPTTAGYGAAITVQTPDAARIASVALIGLAAETHHFDGGATYQSLSFISGSGQVSVTLPGSSASAPAGYYMLFLVDSNGVPSVASILQIAGTDAAPPAVVAASPVTGSTNVPVVAVPSVVFTKSVQPSSISFSLTSATGANITTTTGYIAGTHKATFAPVSPLSYSTAYTATVSNALDLAGHPMVAPYSWSFTTGPLPNNCPCSLWNAAVTPSNPSAGDTGSLELGVRITAEASGYVTGIQFYKGSGNTGVHIGNLWTSGGSLLATATFANETPTGWQSVTFANPVSVKSGAVYIASYFAPNGGYAYSLGYFSSANFDNPPLHALAAGDGIYSYSPVSTFPSTSSSASANYWVDVAFTCCPPPTVKSTFPANGAGASINTLPSANFSQPVQPSTISVALTGPGATAVAGSAAYNSSTWISTFTPAAPLAYGTTYTATISGVVDVHGVAMSGPYTWTFKTPTCPCAIWNSSTTPGNTSASDGKSVELGVKIRPDANGFITGVRFYKGAGNGGSHIGNLWTVTGTRLATVTFGNETASGWQVAAFSNPVAVTAGTDYIVSYFAPQGHYAYDGQFFANAGVDNPPLHALKTGVDGGNGVHAYSSNSTFPATASGAAFNYWVDAVFDPAAGGGAPAGINPSPAPGATGVAATSLVTAAFNKAVQPSTINFSVASGGFAVPGTVNYDPTTYSLTFTPSGALPPAGIVNVSISGAIDLSGTAMAAPATWSFTTAGGGCPCTLFPATATPATASSSDINAVELGVRFTADFSGHVTGVRFYKGAGNTGTHVGNLWTASGQLLATATFTGETASGWQQVNFSTLVAITPGAVYVVSYFAPVGHYAFDAGYFASRYDNPPLHAAIDGNGVYAYRASSGFPTTTSSGATNYWVDLVIGP